MAVELALQESTKLMFICNENRAQWLKKGNLRRTWIIELYPNRILALLLTSGNLKLLNKEEHKIKVIEIITSNNLVILEKCD